MWNSLKVTGISLILIIVLSSTVGYALSKFRIRGKNKFINFLTFRNHGASTDYIDSTVYFL